MPDLRATLTLAFPLPFPGNQFAAVETLQLRFPAFPSRLGGRYRDDREYSLDPQTTEGTLIVVDPTTERFFGRQHWVDERERTERVN